MIFFNSSANNWKVLCLQDCALPQLSAALVLLTVTHTVCALFLRAHTGTCAAKFLARPAWHSWPWLSQNRAHMVNRQQHQWKSSTCFELAGDRSRSIWQERPLVVILGVCVCVCFNDVLRFSAKHMGKGRCLHSHHTVLLPGRELG